ncbi:MAG: aromatic ring-hydroxylating dioxygenase subunit alpha [Flavitalea sp.]
MDAFLTEDLPFKILRREWQPVAISKELQPGEVKSFVLLNTEMVIARLSDGLLAAENSCPHKGARLSLGTVCGDYLQCAYHGWQFEREGNCINIPSLINPPPNKLKVSKLKKFETQERYGMIWVQLEKDELNSLPEIPEFENPEWTYMVAQPTVFKAGFRREIENYLDMTHFAFAHKSTLGKAADPIVPKMDISLLNNGFQMDAPFPSLSAPDELPTKLQEAHMRQQRCYLPNFTTIRQTFNDGDMRVLVHIPTPNTQEECTVFWSIAISPGFKGPAPEHQMAFAVKVLEEDRLMCENQIPKEVPLNPSKGGWGVLVTPGDLLANTFQKNFRQYLLDKAGLPQ